MKKKFQSGTHIKADMIDWDSDRSYWNTIIEVDDHPGLLDEVPSLKVNIEILGAAYPRTNIILGVLLLSS